MIRKITPQQTTQLCSEQNHTGTFTTPGGRLVHLPNTMDSDLYKLYATDETTIFHGVNSHVETKDRLKKTSNRFGRMQSSEWRPSLGPDSPPQLLSLTDPLGRTITCDYYGNETDGGHLLREITLPLSPVRKLNFQ